MVIVPCAICGGIEGPVPSLYYYSDGIESKCWFCDDWAQEQGVHVGLWVTWPPLLQPVAEQRGGDFIVRAVPQQVACLACGWTGMPGDEREVCPECAETTYYVCTVNMQG